MLPPEPHYRMGTSQRCRVVITPSSFPVRATTPWAAFITGRKYTAVARYTSESIYRLMCRNCLVDEYVAARSFLQLKGK